MFTGLYSDLAILDFDDYLIGICFVLFTELCFEIIQAYNYGARVYFIEKSNLQDIAKIVCGFMYIIWAKLDSPWSYSSKYCLCLTVCFSLYQFIELLRAFECFANVVAMVRRSISDMRFFIGVMFFCAYIFSLCLGVL